ncbi:PelD GGDEF domain-containing protein [Comamonas sp. GB3 AK4-5]|uniref:PelD GGDEF domain-containing protein n=1 Tax=Comamonas sp. GB3 AK4-5 TaxID=3231487 RepID=UPI00351EFE52
MDTVRSDPEARRQQAQPGSSPNRWMLGSPLGKLASTEGSTRIRLLEILLLPALFLLVGYGLSPQDPLWVHAEFPWAWLAPIVVALRYGALGGLGASTVLLAGWAVFHGADWLHFPQLYFLGGFITVLVVGEFSSLWRHKTRRAELAQHYLDQRLEHLVRQYYLLRLSHDRLEQELIGRPMSMRDALRHLQTGDDPQKAPLRLLQLLGEYCQISSASLFAVTHDLVHPDALAQLGTPKAPQLQDPLIRQALDTLRLCHVAQTADGAGLSSHYLIAAPLLDLSGTPFALLVVEEMPFYALQDENLQVINLLLHYYCDGLSSHALAQPIVQAYPECPESFAVELQRLSHMQAIAGLDSTLVVLEFSDEAIAHHYPQQILRMRRMLDEHWLMQSPQGRQMLAVLMPLGNASSAEGFLQRIELLLSPKSKQTLQAFGIAPRVFSLGQHPPLALLQHLDGLLHA